MSTEDIIEKVDDLVTVPTELAPDIALEVADAMTVVDPPVDGPGDTVEAVTEPVVEEVKEDVSEMVAVVRKWIPTTGPDVKLFLSAHENGMGERVYAATRAEVEAFVAGLK